MCTNPNDILIDSFLENEIGLDTNFLSKVLCAGLQNNIALLQQDNLMVKAGIGNQTHADTTQQMRGDMIYWMDKAHDNTFEQQFLLQVENFIDRLNSTCYTGINGYEFHYAVYEQGAGYKRHVDQFKSDSKRKFSLINYLNLHWLPAHGGELKVYNNKGSNTIAPTNQTAVFFKSNEVEHEVLQANKTRMSITGWLKRE